MIQSCYDGRFDVKNKVDRYVLLGQSCSDNLKSEQAIGADFLSFETSETSNAIIENCEGLLRNVYSVMADITSAHTGKKSCVSTCLEQFFNHNMGRDIHVLE